MNPISRFVFYIFLSTLLVPLHSAEKTQVNVGISDSGIFWYNKNEPSASVLGYLVDKLNSAQSKYIFNPKLLPRARLGPEVENQSISMVLLMHKEWGFEHLDLVSTIPICRGRSVFIALKSVAKDQSFFSNLQNKRILGVKGFDYNLDKRGKEKDLYKIARIPKEDLIPKMLKLERGDVGIINLHILKAYFDSYPEDKELFLISDKSEEEFNIGILLSKESPIPLSELNKIIKDLKQSSKLKYLIDLYQKSII
ncbi:MAG: hypothetical protein CME71_05060 [Halobacteriovorax sp.]|nr:hypothetical protein [Halobacteriovorax sp.]